MSWLDRAAESAGVCLIDVLAATGLIVTLSVIALPNIMAAVDDFRTAGAARYLSTSLYRIRMEAVARTASTALRFEHAGPTYRYSVVVDGNRNGVLARDIERGIDVEIRAPEQLSDRFTGVDFGALPELPPVDPSSSPPGADPIRIGTSNMITFTPRGSSTPGSLYVRGARNAQYAIRVFGDTGRTRVLKFDPARRVWRPL
jgi:hypothetical protein